MNCTYCDKSVSAYSLYVDTQDSEQIISCDSLDCRYEVDANNYLTLILEAN